MKHLLIVTLFLTFTASVFGQSEETVDYFSTFAYGNPIVGKAGEHYKGVTYIAFQGDLEDPYVAAYDHENDKWIGPYKAGESVLGKNGKIDNHGKPTLVVDGEGYIHLVFGGHGGTKDLGENTLGNYNSGKQIHVRTRNPEDISSWQVIDNVQPFATYSQFIKMDNGDLYLFYRHGAHRSNWVYQISRDNGLTFSPKVSFLHAKPTAPIPASDDVWDSWYINLERGNGNDILVSYNYHVCHNSAPGQHSGWRHSCYFMRFDTDKKEWYNIQNEKLTLPITKEYADNKTLAVNTGDGWNHIGRVGLNSLDYPHVSWYEGEDNGTQHGGTKQLVNYQWNGTEWEGGSTNLPKPGTGEMVIKSPQSISYLLAFVRQGAGIVGWWESTDGGRVFSREESLIEQEGKNFKLSHFIRNAHPDAKIIATQQIAGSDFSRIYLLGKNGPIGRPKAEADEVKLDGTNYIITAVDDDLNSSELLKVYPNPSGSTINIEFLKEGAKNLSIYNLGGQLVWQKNTVINKVQLSKGADLRAGTYLLIVSGDYSTTHKIVIR
ncbi:MAG: BNR-4 repeat-containing protein [Cyclobacteriaceae bacterium]